MANRGRAKIETVPPYHDRPWPGHPRLVVRDQAKSQVAGTWPPSAIESSSRPAHFPCLDQQAQYFEQDRRAVERRQCAGVERGSDLHQVAADEVDATQVT